MRKRLLINCVTAMDRHAVIGEITRVINEGGGSILDHHQFSNLSISIHFEMARSGVESLRDRLAQVGVRLADRSMAEIQQVIADSIAATDGPATEIAGILQITFFHSEPDLYLDVPRVPG